MDNDRILKNKGSVTFVFYFIIGLTLLAVAAYYIGINEQGKLFQSIVTKKQQQEDAVLRGPITDQNPAGSEAPTVEEVAIKSLIDSPITVLKNIKNSVNTAKTVAGGGINSGVGAIGKITFGEGVDPNSSDVSNIIMAASGSQYLIKTNNDKNGVNITLSNGEAMGDVCYNTPTERLCFPYYKLDKIWAIGDLNKDGINDAVISISATENGTANKTITNNFYTLLSEAPIAVVAPAPAVSSSSSIISVPLPRYTIVPFNYGVYSPSISSVEISDNVATLIGGFYVSGDKIGKPSVNKVIRYDVATSTSIEGGDSSVATSPAVPFIYSMRKIAEARLFKEQSESTSIWYPYNYAYKGLNFSFRAPDTWQRKENFDKGTMITFTEPEGRTIVFSTLSIMGTCAEYTFGLSNSTSVKVKSSEFIDLGQFGVGSYIKYAVTSGGDSTYHADICVSDKNGDRSIFGLYAIAKEDSSPYFSIFDKIFSTFKIN